MMGIKQGYFDDAFGYAADDDDISVVEMDGLVRLGIYYRKDGGVSSPTEKGRLHFLPFETGSWTNWKQ